MDLQTLAQKLRWLPPSWRAALEKRLLRIPAIQKRTARETAEMLGQLEGSLKPYREEFATFRRIPEIGLEHAQILVEMEQLQARERARWKEGFVSGAVYHGNAEHIAFLNRVYALNSQSNPLHTDIWPSTTKYEAEIVAMTARLLGAGESATVCGAVSSGGTESILLAMKAYRDWARDRNGIRSPEMIVPTTAHAAFAKAAQYFGIRLVRVPVGSDFRADVAATRRAITRNTAVIVGSAPDFPHGLIDPIQELSELARERGIGFHTDACLGGFVLPWAKRLGYAVPAFDFSLPGVTSISADTHKFGYAAKGTSVILYHTEELRRYQYFATSEWPGGLYCSPTFAGSRPGALSAACWAALVAMGESGYLDATARILKTGQRIKEGVRAIPDLCLIGDPLFVIAFASDTLDVYKLMALMTQKGWSLNGLFAPPAVHICITLRHTQPGIAERFLADLRGAVEMIKSRPELAEQVTPIYGTAASQPLRGFVDDFLKAYLDMLYKISDEQPGAGDPLVEAKGAASIPEEHLDSRGYLT